MKYSSFQQETKHLKNRKWQKFLLKLKFFLLNSDKASLDLGLGMLLTLFGLSGKHKGKEKY